MLRQKILQRFAIYLCPICLALWCGPLRVAGAWRWSSPKPHGNNIVDVAFQGGTYWEVGDRGSIYTSPDLDNWTPMYPAARSSLRSIAFFGSKVFISGEAGTILSGDDPANLQVIDLGTNDWLEGITAGPDVIVAVGDNGAIYTSQDGLGWMRQDAFTTSLRSVAYGNGLYVVVGEDGFIATSADGQSWSGRTPIVGNHLNHISYTDNKFWIVGDGGVVLTNNTRLGFVAFNIGTTSNLFAVANSTNEVVIAGDSVVYLNAGNSGGWESQTGTNSTSVPPWPYYSALWDGRAFVLGGRGGFKVEGFRTNNNDAIRWYSEEQVTRGWLWGVTRTPEFYAAVGTSGTIVSSPNGVDWQSESVPGPAQSEVLLGIGGSTDMLLAVGTGGTILYSPNTFTNVVRTNTTGDVTTNQVSLFGVIWNQANSGTSADLQGITPFPGGFIATGSGGTILHSSDAKTWVPQISGKSVYLSSITSYPGGLVAVGDLGTVLQSANGTLWLSNSSGVTNWIYTVRYLAGQFVAVGEGGLILTSSDGTSWSRQTSGTSKWLNDVTFLDGIFYVAATGGLVLTSTDAIAWKIEQPISVRSLYGLAGYKGQLIAIGTEGTILRNQLNASSNSVDFLEFGRTNGVNAFLMKGALDQRFSLQSETSVGSGWQTGPTLEISRSDGTLIYEAPDSSSGSKFFRTRLE